jgi:hypothetical protein
MAERRQKVLDRMVASITRIQPPLKFPPESGFDLLYSFPNMHFQDEISGETYRKCNFKI